MTLLSTFGRHFGLSTGSTFSVTSAFAVLRQRRALANLDEHALQDLGLTHADVNEELKRPVWDVPSNWRG